MSMHLVHTCSHGFPNKMVVHFNETKVTLQQIHINGAVYIDKSCMKLVLKPSRSQPEVIFTPVIQ